MGNSGRADHILAHMIAAVDAAPLHQEPFCYITLQDFFPAGVYRDIVAAMPDMSAYRVLPGRNNYNLRADGSSTRDKLDLLPEYLRHLSREQRVVWREVIAALNAPALQAAFVRKLASGLERRFGPDATQRKMYPLPVLVRDTQGYRIPPHTDTHWKAITVQLYLPEDVRDAGIGTIMNRKEADGAFSVAYKAPFVPNSGYGFAVNDISWHSADPVGPQVTKRDSILLTYYLDTGLWRMMRNRGKRLGNMVLNELRRLGR